MRTILLPRLFLPLCLVLCACGGQSSPEATAGEEEDPCPSLAGSWELVSIEDDAPALTGAYETDPNYQEAPTLKILNDTHWMFIRQSADNFIHAQGGRYTLQNGIYTEVVEYSAIPGNVGLSFVFECRLEGDSLWYHTGGLGDHRYQEVWRRVK
ncbi:MAG: hypothetical protein KatS3mg044_1206 [Rhodothermaceae bacterium]|nr:MAG: hypothetical protein KatS3mg044_1206 [Rhodothermaceae bacterium]